MITILMDDDKYNKETVDDAIKLFLSMTDAFDKSFNNYDLDKMDKTWLFRKGNFISLLNLPEQIHRFGPLRSFWEGRCERYIQNVKRYLTNVRPTNTYLLSRTRQFINDSRLSAFLDANNRRESNHFSYKIYAINFQLQQSLKNNCVVAGLISQNNFEPDGFYILQKEKDKLVKIYNVKFHDKNGYWRNGVWYSMIKVGTCKIYKADYINSILNKVGACTPAVMLKDILVLNSPNSYFCVVTEDWRIRNEHNSYQPFQLCSEIFKQ